MHRRESMLALLGLAAAPLCAFAQREGAMRRVGHLSGGGEFGSVRRVDAFRESMRALGYIEDKTYVLDQRYADANFERLPALARALLEGGPDVLLASTTPGALAAKQATRTIPIVFVGVADPVGAGIVPHLGRPGANITGITNITVELAGKRLELIKEIVPTAKRIAVLINPSDQNAPLQMRSAESAARRLEIELRPVLAVRNPDDLPKAFEAASRANAAAIIRMVDPLASMLQAETMALAAKHRLPVVFPHPEDAQAGGLIAYGTSIPDQYRQAAALVDKILRGANPGDLPVEQPRTFELVINLRAARELGVTIPRSMLLRASQVIE